MSDIQQEVHDVLSSGQDKIQFEEIPGEESSPLNQPVHEKKIAGSKGSESHDGQTEEAEQVGNEANTEESTDFEPPNSAPNQNYDDAPEQEIDEDYSETTVLDTEEEEFELPPSHAKQAADTVLGMANNVLAVGSGFFIKIRKHKEFYEFEEIIQVIDKQNDKNVKRIKLDEEDEALLRPLLIQVLKNKAKKLTPEQQLMGAIISILMKKAQVVMEVRAENEILVERILDIVREEKGYSEQDEEDEEEPEAEPQKQAPQEPIVEKVIVEEEVSQTIQPEQVLEVAEVEEDEREES